MFDLLTIVATVLVSVAMALSVAHALEFPGKLRLSKEHYLAVQAIYYPGFTIAGTAEPLGVLALLAVAFTTSTAAGFWHALAALAALSAAHGCYWLVTHPVNNFWLRDTRLVGAGKSFFGSDPIGRGVSNGEEGVERWRELRNRWEWSHVARAVLSAISFLVLVVTLSNGAL